jgi:hypothetical protein
MRVEPFNTTGLEIIPDNEWEEAFLFLLEEKLNDKNFFSDRITPFSIFSSFLLSD